MKKFFNSPWPLIISMLIGTATALFTSLDFIANSDNVQPVKKTPTASTIRQP